MTPQEIIAAIVLSAVVIAILIAIAVATTRRSHPGDIAASRNALIQIEPQDNPGLLLAAMRTFEGTGHISFEGIEPGSGLSRVAGAADMETSGLRRATRWPRLDFVVIPLTSQTIDAISKLIVWVPSEPTPWDPDAVEDDREYPTNFTHVQIAVDDHCVFGAWDDFHEECVIATDKFPLEVLDRLVAEGCIRSYTIDTYPYRGRYWHAP